MIVRNESRVCSFCGVYSYPVVAGRDAPAEILDPEGFIYEEPHAAQLEGDRAPCICAQCAGQAQAALEDARAEREALEARLEEERREELAGTIRAQVLAEHNAKIDAGWKR